MRMQVCPELMTCVRLVFYKRYQVHVRDVVTNMMPCDLLLQGWP